MEKDDGFRHAVDAMHAPSVTNTIGAPHTRLCLLSPKFFGLVPMRAEPIW